MTRAALVVVGGGPAGLAAARGYRDAGGTGDVVILAGERHAPYRRPPLTKEYLRGELDGHELALEQPGWFESHSVRLETGVAAVALDPDARVIATERGELGFERCVLATGAQPRRPDLPGADDPGLHTIRTPEDADALRQLAPGERVLVIGSGFIGCEAAVSLAWRGMEVELVTDERRPQEARLGEEVGERLAGWLTDAGVSLRLESPVAALGPRGPTAELESGARVEASAVILCLGIEPDVALGRAAGIELDEGRYACDESGRTNVRGVLAAGDAARLRNSAAGRRLSVEHWGEALAQGEIAGRTAAGAEASWNAVPGFWSTLGRRTIKQAAWGDGHDEVRVLADGSGWTAWYGREGRCVGVLAHERYHDYDGGRQLVAAGGPLPS